MDHRRIVRSCHSRRTGLSDQFPAWYEIVRFGRPSQAVVRSAGLRLGGRTLLNLSVETAQSRLVIHFDGELDYASIGQVERVVTRAVEVAPVTLDLSKLTFIDVRSI